MLLADLANASSGATNSGDARRVRVECANQRVRERVHLFGMKYIASEILHEFVNGVVFQRRKFHASSTRRCHHGFLRRTRTAVRHALSKTYASDLTRSLRGSLRFSPRRSATASIESLTKSTTETSK